ncbi:amino acid adenylation domain-containing protein [Treponema sp.]|uniref:amino acid adenylation domain-containing protein n=1 Tax=Treponema sp. TaxID=166 RepID=UPI003F0EA624
MSIRLVTDYLDASAEKYPEKIAFADENREISFSQVKSEALKIATKLINDSVFKKPVVIYLDKSVEVLVSFMGAAYSGNFYTPIDTGMPSSRIEKIMETLCPAVIITDEAHRNAASEFSGNTPVILYSDIQKLTADEALVEQAKTKILDTDILYVLFTSGSTGTPKGVIISQKACIDYAEWVTKTFDISSSTIFGEQAPFYFDNSILDIYQTLKNGATLYIIPQKFFMLPKQLFEFLAEKKVNTIFWVPSALCIMANLKAVGKFPVPTLKKVLFCGEVMPNKQLNVWRKAFPDCLYANLYGPTEITDVCAYYIVDREFSDDESLPIGFACENTEIIVLNDKNERVQKDEKGELCVRGTCLSYGYYNNPEKTQAAFVQNPLNSKYPEIIYRTGDIVHYNERGELMYDCRKDFQIKHMGHRIELGEIETAVSAVEGVEQNCCLYDTEHSKIVMFFTGSVEAQQIIDSIKNAVPEYMIPNKKIKLDKMPINLNGKIDRVELKKML